jgi:hypothetical protein
MRKIGFDGGNLICEVGTTADVELFFECLRIYAEAIDPTVDWGLLTDRLYRRYLRLDELDRASALMERTRSLFGHRPSASSVDWSVRNTTTNEHSGLNPNQPTLADVFVKYFDNFSRCVASARSSYERFKSYPGYQYQPVRLVISDLAGYARDKKKPLADYDALTGKPYWLQ